MPHISGHPLSIPKLTNFLVFFVLLAPFGVIKFLPRAQELHGRVAFKQIKQHAQLLAALTFKFGIHL